MMYEVLVKFRIRLVRNAVLIRDNVRWFYREYSWAERRG